MNTSQLPKPGENFQFGTGKAGNRGLGYQLRKLSSTGRSGVSAFRNLSKENIKTIESILKPYRKSLKGIGTYSTKPGLGKYEIKRANKKAWKSYKQDIGSGKSDSQRFTKEDVKDFKEITKQLSKEAQKDTIDEKKRARLIAYRRQSYQDDNGSTSGTISVSNTPHSHSIDTGIAHGTISISQLMKGGQKPTTGGIGINSGIGSTPKPINRNFGLKI